MYASARRRPDDSTPCSERAPRILARGLFRDLQSEGFDARQIQALAAELALLAERERRANTPS